MSWIENRLSALEQRFESWVRQLQDLIPQIRKAAQDARNAYQQYQPGGGGSSGAFYCLPTSLSGATGSWPSITPASQSLTIYQVVSGALSSIGSATVYNFYPSAPSASKVAQVIPVGDGTYVLVAQSCT